MRKLALIVAGAAALLGAPALQARDTLSGEAKLAKILEGRVAGEPVNCISTYQTRNTRIIDKTAIVYDAGNVIYVNRPQNAATLNSSDVMVTRPFGSQLCSVDMVHLRDSSLWFSSGVVGLNEFVPYRRVARN